jgi:hypothetical protein
MLGLVNKTGFYSIAVTPELSSYIKTDFSDLRVVDADGKQAEYLIHHVGSPSVSDSTVYKQMNIVSKKETDSGSTITIIENNLKEKISSIALLIGNASVSRTANLSGSDDKKKWFSIWENISLNQKYVSDTDKYAEILDFPMVSYRYIKLVIYNGKNYPLNIISAGRYVGNDNGIKISHIDNPSIQNPNVHFFQKDSSDGYSYVNVHDSIPFQIDRISFAITGPKFFKRDAELVIPYTYGANANFTLLSNSVFNLDVPVFKAKDWLIKIYNGDNPPLKITGISTYQQEKNIVTWLDSGKTYHLEMDNPNAVAPQYDLQMFKDSIPKNVIPLAYKSIDSIVIETTPKDTSVFKQSWLWAVIVLVLAVLVYFTWQLTKEVAKK